jgi:aromatic ring-opening dioxygenase catalytic subunit (LigB family)
MRRMGKVIGGAATSHAYALEDPSVWDAGRERVRAFYARRYGRPAAEHPRALAETPDEAARRHGKITEALARVRARVSELRPDAIVIVADDQDEIFTEDTYPQIAVYTGKDFVCRGRHQHHEVHGTGQPALAHDILTAAVESEFDMAVVGTLRDNVLGAHAFGPVLYQLDPEATIPVVPIFVNAVHTPAPTPRRCYVLGRAIANGVARSSAASRVLVVGSGGLSHYPGSYPGYPNGDFPFGSIDEKFDRRTTGLMSSGRGSELANLTSTELLESGNIELRAWISVMGAVGDRKAELLAYEPIYRGLMGMAVGLWTIA